MAPHPVSERLPRAMDVEARLAAKTAAARPRYALPGRPETTTAPTGVAGVHRQSLHVESELALHECCSGPDRAASGIALCCSSSRTAARGARLCPGRRVFLLPAEFDSLRCATDVARLGRTFISSDQTSSSLDHDSCTK